MNKQRQWIVAALVVLIVPCGAITVHASPSASYPVAGLAPYQRPVNAPIQNTRPVLDTKQAMHGISSPVPGSLKFLKDQGGWFTPFTHPGMTGHYDLRGWHAAPLPAAIKK